MCYSLTSTCILGILVNMLKKEKQRANDATASNSHKVTPGGDASSRRGSTTSTVSSIDESHRRQTTVDRSSDRKWTVGSNQSEQAMHRAEQTKTKIRTFLFWELT